MAGAVQECEKARLAEIIGEAVRGPAGAGIVEALRSVSVMLMASAHAAVGDAQMMGRMVITQRKHTHEAQRPDV